MTAAIIRHRGRPATSAAANPLKSISFPDRRKTLMRVFNFSAGPAVLPEPVLRQAAAEMLDWHGSGMSVMEMSHRGKEFIGIADKAEADLRTLLAIPDNYKVLFLQGGAIAENAIVPMNLLQGRTTADYVNTGEWSKKSIQGSKEVLRGEHRGLVRGQGLHVRAGAERVAAERRPGLRARLHQRDHRRRRISLDARHGQRAAGGGHVVAHPVAAGRRREVRRHLRRRAEEHGAGGTHARDRARRPARPRAADHAVGVPLEGAGGGGFDAQHAGDLRYLHRRAGVRMAAWRRAGSRRSSSRTSRRPHCSTTTWTRVPSIATRCGAKTARG